MLTLVDADTALVVIVKLADEAPVGTLTLLGVAATLVFALASETTEPPEGAAAVRATVPTVDVPPTTLFDPNDNENSAGDAFVPPVTTQMSPSTRELEVVAMSRTHVVLFGNPANVVTGKLTLVAP